MSEMVFKLFVYLLKVHGLICLTISDGLFEQLISNSNNIFSKVIKRIYIFIDLCRFFLIQVLIF